MDLVLELHDLLPLAVNEEPILLDDELQSRAGRHLCRGSSTEGGRIASGPDESRGRAGQGSHAGRCRQVEQSAVVSVAVLVVHKTRKGPVGSQLTAAAAEGVVQHLIPLHGGHNVLLEMLHGHGRNVPELLEQFVRLWRILVDHHLPQDPVALVQHLKNTNFYV